MRERLQKILSRAGVASRRRAESLIAAGEISVNGLIAVIGDSADVERDEILVRGLPLETARGLRYMALNKPPGYVTSRRSTHGEKTVFELVEDTTVFPVGRLDKETSGLLLFTNDGDWANLVIHPRHGVEKEYRAIVRGVPGAEALKRLRQGVALADGVVTAPARVRSLHSARGTTLLAITLSEGKKRQIREMLVAVGNPVMELARIRVGPIQLGDLEPGRCRELESDEVEAVRHAAQSRATRPGPRPANANRAGRPGGRGQVDRGSRRRGRA